MNADFLALQTQLDEAKCSEEVLKEEVLTVEDKMKTTLYLGSSRRDDLVTLDSAITNKTDQVVRLKRD